MYRNGFLTTKQEVAAVKPSEYLFPTEDMTFKGTLDSRCWEKKNFVVCNFTAENGSKIKLIAYLRKEATGNTYSPKKCAFNFADEWVEGLSFVCTVRMNGNGRHVWVSAE